MLLSHLATFSGVGRTVPQVIPYRTQAEATSWALQLDEDPLPNTTSYAIARRYARAQVTNSIAAVTTKDISPYVSTAQVARDMLSIVEAYGEEKLRYWGIS